MRWEQYHDGKRVALCGAAFYWAVKRMCRDLALRAYKQVSKFLDQ